MKYDVIGGSVVSEKRELILFTFVLDKPPEYKVICEPETKDNKKMNKSVLNTIALQLEHDDHKSVIFNAETLIFTLQLIKIWTIKSFFKNLKVILIGLEVGIDLLRKTVMVLYPLKVVKC